MQSPRIARDKRSKTQKSPASSNSAADFFSVPLVEMSTLDAPELRGIYTPAPEIGQAKVGITSQFLDDASVYHEKYSNVSYFKALISTALERIGPALRTRTPRILDIGSGSGNSVFPCLELFPECRIIATDLSPNLLKILLEHVEKNAQAAGRVMPVCMDATRDYYKKDAFDLVIGAAILHHLVDPGAAITAAARALAPGGNAIFFEPFEGGSAILALAFAEILAREEADRRPADRPEAKSTTLRWLERVAGLRDERPPGLVPLPEKIRRLFRALIDDYALRTGSDKSAPIYEKIDDEMALRTLVYRSARQSGGVFRRRYLPDS